MNSTVKEIAGGKWWKVDFHVHTPASMDYGKGSRQPEKEKQVTPKEFLLKAIEKNIDCLVISDHNSFEWIDKLREAMDELIQDNPNIAPVIIFPAVEINVMGNIHLLAIFNIDVEVRNLERIFGQIGFDEKVLSTTKSMPEVMEIVIKNKGIAIPAHVDCPSGLFETNSASEIKGVLNVDELLAFEVIGSEINNQIYKDSKRKISYVAGSDSHCIDTIGSRYTWVKMGKPSIEAMRLALFDNIDGVLRSDFYEGNPNDLKNRMFLKYVEIKQAKYAGRRAPLHIDFSPWMTSIIGGRGTGKSSIIQFVRLILDKKEELPKALQKEFDDFVNISKNRTELGMFTDSTEIRACIVKDGLEYNFIWKNDELYEMIGGQLEEATGLSERFPIRIFNQKQLFEMTKDAQLLLQYIDSQWDSIGWRKSLDSTKNKYVDCMIRINNNNIKVNEKKRKEIALREIENKIKVFETEATKKVLDSQKEILIAEQQAKSVYRKYEDVIDKSIQLYKSVLELSENSLNIDKLDKESKKEIDQWESEINAFILNYKDAYEKNQVSFCQLDVWFSKLNVYKNKEENQIEMNNIINELKEQGVDDIEIYPVLLKQKDDLLKELEEYIKVEQIDEELKQERMTILEEYYTLIQQRYENRERTVSSWNEAGNLRITLLPMGNMEKNEEVFRNIINKQGTTFSSDILERNKEEEYSGGIVFRLANPENGNYLENYKAMCEELTNRNSSTYGKKFRAHLNNLFENDYSVENEIYMWLPEDLVRLELKTGRNKYISIDAGSAGQRTSAILTLLLQMSKEPIIIDQPEDDLDTKNITDFIVKGINEKKQSQQIIVVTHNPNIVVNTNSEQVIHMEFAGGEINASHSGALQDVEIRDAICDVMEGGREALESRYYRITKALE